MKKIVTLLCMLTVLGLGTSTLTAEIITDPTTINLSVVASKSGGGTNVASLKWDPEFLYPAIFRDGQPVEFLFYGGEYVDVLNSSDRATHTYQVCQLNSDICSNVVTVSWGGQK